MKPIQIYLQPAEIKKLKQEALDKGITLSDLVRLYLTIKQRAAKQEGVKLDKVIPEKVLVDHSRPVVVQPSLERQQQGLCKTHGTPLTERGKCLQKGCKQS